MDKRFTLKRVGAGPGAAIFECEHVLGQEVVVVDAMAYNVLERALLDIIEQDECSGCVLIATVALDLVRG